MPRQRFAVELPVKSVIRDFNRVWSLVERTDRVRLRWAMIGSVVLAGLDMVGVGLVLPLAMLLFDGDSETTTVLQPIADLLGIESTMGLAAVVAAAVLIIFLSRGVFGVLLVRHTLRIALGAEAVMAGRLLRRYLHAPLEYHVGHNTAEMQRTIGESLRRIYQDALVTMVPALGDAVMVALIAALLLILAPIEAVAGGLVLAVVVIAYRRIAGARAKMLSEEMVAGYEASLFHIQQSLGAVREIQLSDSADAFADDLLAVRQGLADRQRRLLLTELLPRYLLEFGMLASAGAVGAIAFWRLPTDRAVAVLALFVAAVVRILPSLNRVLLATTRLSVAQPNIAAVRTTLSELESVSDYATDSNPIPAEEAFAQFTADDVDFVYSGAETFTLAGSNLTIARGDYLGIIGDSGAGKTTLLNLLLGFLQPTRGEIRVNGRPLSECGRSWQHRVGYVPQDVAFLDTSVAKNVALGTSPDEIDVDGVRDALRKAHLLEVVEGLPDGLDTSVKEAGARLSGGQRQRLGLARALYRKPEVLVLDEATSALDTATEQRLLATLDELREEMTIVVVAHRATTIAPCERVLRIDKGVLSEPGAVDDRAEDPNVVASSTPESVSRAGEGS